MQLGGLNHCLKKMVKQYKKYGETAINKLSNYGNIIGNILKWGTAIGVVVSAVIWARDLKTMITSDHKTITEVPAKIQSIQSDNEAKWKEYEVRWQEQHRIDSVQNKQFGENEEVRRIMSESNRVINTAIQTMEDLKKNESLNQLGSNQ